MTAKDSRRLSPLSARMTAGLMPVLSFPGIGEVPNVPTDLVGEAKLML